MLSVSGYIAIFGKNSDMKSGFIVAIIAAVFATSCNTVRYESYTDTIEVNGVKIFYAAEGAGKPVILLHAVSYTHLTLPTMAVV